MIWCIDYLDGEELKFMNIEADNADDARDKFECEFSVKEWQTMSIEEISCVA
jgi:hypothetical protein